MSPSRRTKSITSAMPKASSSSTPCVCASQNAPKNSDPPVTILPRGREKNFASSPPSGHNRSPPSGIIQQGRDGTMTTRVAIPLALLALGLAGCGTTPGDRGLSGAGIGAAGGAVAGALVGAPLVGAAIGAGAGAAAGAATSPSTIDLGTPVWER